MEHVPNAIFRGELPRDEEYGEPPGCYLARKLEAHLRRFAQDVAEFDNWRDAGWMVECSLAGVRFEIYFAVYEPTPAPSLWMLQIAPLGQPGFVKRLFGAQPTAYGVASRRLAAEVHGLLKDEPTITGVAWAMNADPRKGAVEEPSALDWPKESVS